MQELVLEKRVDRLERVMMELAYQSRRTEMEIERLSIEMREFKDEMKDFKDEMLEFKNEMKDFKDEMLEFKNEMKEFKDGVQVFKDEMLEFKNEMKDFKDEMLEFKDEMKVFKDEMKAFKDEMKDFKDEMREFKDEVRREIRESNKQWGNLSNKLGTIVEDIIAPAIAPTLKKYFQCDPEEVAIRVKKRKGDLKDEFDAIATCGDKVFLFEVKSTPKADYVTEFKEQKTERFRILFPEYEDKQLILIFASLRLEEDILNLLTKYGIYGMAYREWEYMDILNFDEVSRARN